MKPESRRFLHMGINYIVLPAPQIDRRISLGFQEALISAGIEFTNSAVEENHILVQRKPPFPLEMRVAVQISQPQPFGQILIIAPHPNRRLENFISETEAVLNAFVKNWPSASRQILSCDVALRCLYESTSRHAFEELWERRLGQPSESLGVFRRKVLGGGLRFVMPPQPGDIEPSQVEVKIESYLQDPKKVFVETQFMWPNPSPPGSPFNAADRLHEVNNFITDQVHAFLMGPEHE
jgi:hypothetical protein